MTEITENRSKSAEKPNLPVFRGPVLLYHNALGNTTYISRRGLSLHMRFREGFPRDGPKNEISPKNQYVSFGPRPMTVSMAQE